MTFATQHTDSYDVAAAKGFVLPLTLWIIALFGLGIAAINSWVSTAVDNARVLQQKAEAELVFANIENELVYAMATRPMSPRGLEVGADITRLNTDDVMAQMAPTFQSSNYIAFDGRAYIPENNTDYLIHLQDGRGLLKLQAGAAAPIQRLLTLFDVPETLRNQLPDTLADWIDDDDLTRLAGAEASDYERRRRLSPTNAQLLTPMEAQSILGWDEISEIWAADLESPLLTTCSVTGFNPNTAPETVLLSYIPGLTKTAAAQVIERRQTEPFRHAREFMSAAGFLTAAEPFFFSVTPSNCVIVDIVHRETNRRTRHSISLVPTSQNKPWQVNYAIDIPSRYSRPSNDLDPQFTFPAPETINPGGDGDNRITGFR